MRSQTDILQSLIAGFEDKSGEIVAKGSNRYNEFWEISANIHAMLMQADKYLQAGLLEFMPNEVSTIMGQEVSLLSTRASELDIKRKDASATTISVNAIGISSGTIDTGFKITFNDVDFLLDETTDIIPGNNELQFTSDAIGVESNIVRENDVLKISESSTILEEDFTVIEVLTQGRDQETVDNFRERIIQAERYRDQGGAYADFVEWAKNSGDFVAHATIYTRISNPGQIDIYIESNYRDDLGIPTLKMLETVHNYFYDNNFLPLNSAVVINPISRSNVVVDIKANATALSTDGKDNIQTALDELIYNKRPFLLGQSRLPENAELSYAEIYSTIGLVVANFGGKLLEVGVKVNGVDLDVIESRFGERFNLESINFVTV